MNDVSNRAVREFSEFLNSIEADFPKPTCTTAYEITMKSTIVSALITLDTEKQMDERFWNHLRVQRNILNFLYALWLDGDRTLVDEFSTIMKDLVEYDFEITDKNMKQMYFDDDKSKTADLNAVRDLLDKRQSLSDQIEQLEQEKTAIEQQVKLEMQDAAYGTAPGYKVSWVSSESKRVDSQRLKKEQPDIFNQYSKNVSSRRFTIIHAA